MIRISEQAAISYIENNFDTRGSNMKARIRECLFCGSTSYDVSFNYRTQIMTSFCCDKNTDLIDVVKRDQGLRSTKQAVEFLSKYGGGNIVWVRDSENLVSQDVNIKVQAIRERMLAKVADDKVSSKSIDLSKFSFDFTFNNARRFLNYALKRNVPDWFIESGRLGYAKFGSMRNRLIFLTVENDEAVFAVGRAIDDEIEPKYLATSTAELPDGADGSDFVFNLDLVDEGSDIVVHEGVLSALSGKGGDVATFGKGISEIQIEKIASKNPSSVLFLIEQGVDIPRVVQNALKVRAKGIPTMTAPLLRGDMNDDSSQFEEVLSNAVVLDRFSLIRSKLENRKTI